MSRTLTSGMQTAIALDVVRPVQLVEMAFDGGTSYVTTAPHSVVSAGTTFVGLGALLSIDRIEEREAVAAPGVRLSLSGIDATLVGNAFSEHIQGRDLIIYQGLMDTDHQVITSPSIAWKGYMDTMAIELGDQATITLTGTHRLADVTRPRGGRYNDADQQGRFAGDLYFEFLEELQNAQLVWGFPLNAGVNVPRDIATQGYGVPTTTTPGLNGYIVNAPATRTNVGGYISG